MCLRQGKSYADDCTLTFICEKSEHHQTVVRINQALQSIASCGKRWQSSYTPRRQEDTSPRSQSAPSVLSWTLTFTSHVKKVAKDVVWKRICVRRVAHLDPQQLHQSSNPFQQRRDVAGLCVMYKVLRTQFPQMSALRLHTPAPPPHTTRAAHNLNHQMAVPYAMAEH
ncbi:hypothetical protein O3P69_016579 [Scylla paramamosain]|uniref:Uncharacterized protein n=1 Tax=Scylla paramamosain TaxID=85552 RepID=A0AAW0SXH0_SCYPA